MTTYTANEFVYFRFLLATLVGFHFDTSNVIYKLMLWNRYFYKYRPQIL